MLVQNSLERRGYVDTAAGQIHFREIPGSGQAVVMLHWAPGSSHQYAPAMRALARHGYRPVAPDLPGFGLSARRDGAWSIGDFANNALEAMAAWSDGPLILWGGHLAAEIALEAALTEPCRVKLLVLDGTPTWDRATREKILDSAIAEAPQPDEQGDHLVEIWRHLLWEVNLWRPNAEFDAELGRFTMSLMTAKLLADFDTRPAIALLNYDAIEALRRVQVPVLALSADGDPLRDCHDTVVECLSASPRATSHIFPGDHPLHDSSRADEYIAPFVSRMAPDGDQ